jgi:very-short-patch-repair endonuclease
VDVDRWLRSRAGVVRRRELLARGVTDADIKRRVRAGEWALPFRGVVASAAVPEPAHVRRARAALVAAGPGAYLCCLGAAALRRLPLPTGTALHVTVPSTRSVRPQPGLRAHRDALERSPTTYAGLPTVGVEAALIGSFGCLDDVVARRALVIESVRDGRTTAARLLTALRPRTRRRPELLALLGVCDGSQSEAEIAMLVRVIRAYRLPEPQRQFCVDAGGRSYRLDLAYPEALLAIEVDGKAWHFNAERRNGDIRRDAELAADGWLTLRFTYEQITGEPGWVAGCIAAALTARPKIT